MLHHFYNNKLTFLLFFCSTHQVCWLISWSDLNWLGESILWWCRTWAALSKRIKHSPTARLIWPEVQKAESDNKFCFFSWWRLWWRWQGQHRALRPLTSKLLIARIQLAKWCGFRLVWLREKTSKLNAHAVGNFVVFVLIVCPLLQSDLFSWTLCPPPRKGTGSLLLTTHVMLSPVFCCLLHFNSTVYRGVFLQEVPHNLLSFWNYFQGLMLFTPLWSNFQPRSNQNRIAQDTVQWKTITLWLPAIMWMIPSHLPSHHTVDKLSSCTTGKWGTATWTKHHSSCS